MSKPDNEVANDGIPDSHYSSPDWSEGSVVDLSQPGHAKALIGVHLAAQVQANSPIIAKIKRKARIWRLYRALGLF